MQTQDTNSTPLPKPQPIRLKLVQSRYNPGRGGHAPGDLRDAFCEALKPSSDWKTARLCRPWRCASKWCPRLQSFGRCGTARTKFRAHSGVTLKNCVATTRTCRSGAPMARWHVRS